MARYVPHYALHMPAAHDVPPFYTQVVVTKHLLKEHAHFLYIRISDMGVPALLGDSDGVLPTLEPTCCTAARGRVLALRAWCLKEVSCTRVGWWGTPTWGLGGGLLVARVWLCGLGLKDFGSSASASGATCISCVQEIWV